MKHIPYGRQHIGQDDIDEVVKVLKSDWLTQGPAIEKFENELSRYCNAGFSVVSSNGTTALHLACIALDVGSGDIVWTSPNTFVASANCARYCGADVDFVDICSKTYNMSAIALEEKLIQAKKHNKLPKVVVPVHFAGQSCDMQAIHKLSEQYGFKIIEDACHAIGGEYQQKKIGSCQYSDITVFSFHPVKIITTGEGGACVTNDKVLAEKMKLYRTHGITRNEEEMTTASEGGWYYQQKVLGFNYRITDIQCALGSSQLKRVDKYVEKREEIATTYNRELSHLPLVLPSQMGNARSAWHLYVVQVLPENNSRKNVFNKLRESGIGVNVHYSPVHLHPYYRKLGFNIGDFPRSEYYYNNTVSLPMYPTLSLEDQRYVICKLSEILK